MNANLHVVPGGSELGASPPTPISDSDRLKALAAYVNETARMLEVKLSGVEYDTLHEVANGGNTAHLAEMAAEDAAIVRSAKTDAYHLAKGAVRAVQHFADSDYWERASDPTSDEVDPAQLLYGNGTPVTTDVQGTSTYEGWQMGLGGSGGECASFTRTMTPHPAAPVGDLQPTWTTDRPDLAPDGTPQ